MTAFGVVLLVSLSAAGLLISVIALLIGSEKKQRRLQRKAMMSGVACLLLLIISFSYGVFAITNDLLTFIGYNPEHAGSSVAKPKLPPTSAQKRQWFQWATQLELPDGVVLLEGVLEASGIFNEETYYVRRRADYVPEPAESLGSHLSRRWVWG